MAARSCRAHTRIVLKLALQAKTWVDTQICSGAAGPKCRIISMEEGTDVAEGNRQGTLRQEGFMDAFMHDTGLQWALA